MFDWALRMVDYSKLPHKTYDQYRKYMMYLLAVVDRIRMEVAKFGKCEVEKTVLTELYNQPWHEPSSFHHRIDCMAEDLGMDVEWDHTTKPPTATFTKKREPIIIVAAPRPGPAILH